MMAIVGIRTEGVRQSAGKWTQDGYFVFMIYVIFDRKWQCNPDVVNSYW
jgi:hypothetical protein